MTEKLNVAINAQVLPGRAGGVAFFVRSLVEALGQLTDGPETYSVIVSSDEQWNWLSSHLGPNQTLKMWRPVDRRPFLERALRPLRPAVRYMRRLMNTRVWPEVPLSDGYFESLGCDVVHFPTQNFILCAMPSIYNPHDLQHLHFPQFWTPETIAWRETVYPAGCYFAHTVAVGSEWVKNDVVRHYQISPEKIQVIREAPSTQSFPTPTQASLSKVKEKYGLDQPFAFYPAVTWSHKNHVRLLKALAYLRDARGVNVNLVCTGSRYDHHWPPIDACLENLKLRTQVTFLGLVPDEELRAIYCLGRLLVLPTLFEANSLPIFEAWQEGLPVACSDIPALVEQVSDAALVFNPMRVEAIAEAVARVFLDSRLREDLRARGFQRLQEFSWERTARTYRAVYRRTAGYPLSDEDHSLLGGNEMAAPRTRKRSVAIDA